MSSRPVASHLRGHERTELEGLFSEPESGWVCVLGHSLDAEKSRPSRYWAAPPGSFTIDPLGRLRDGSVRGHQALSGSPVPPPPPPPAQTLHTSVPGLFSGKAQAGRTPPFSL